MRVLSKKKTIDFLKGTTPRMSEWRMYRHMYYEQKLKPFVDQAHDAAREKFNQRECMAGGKQAKEPKRVVSWTAVAMEHYEKETLDIKQKVRDAIEEHAKLTKNGPLLEGDLNGKIDWLEAYAIQHL